MSTPSEQSQLLQKGVQALRTGNKKRAYDLFITLIEQDETNEQAWLWLSGAVDSDEERLVCLENVLTINPTNEAARKGLAQLQKTAASPPAAGEESEETAVRRLTAEDFTRQGKSSLSSSTDILYPERPTVEYRYHDPTPHKQMAQAEYISESSFEDIWTTDETLCAYCAHPLQPEETKCSNCGRQLTVQYYRYPKPSSNLHILWVLLAGVGLQFLLRAGYEQFAIGASSRATLQLLLMLLFFGAAVGIYLRQQLAQLGTILLTVLVFIYNLVSIFLPPDLEYLGLVTFDAAIVGFVGPLLSGLGQVLFLFQMVTLVLTLYFAAFAAAPDFDKVTVRNIATIARGVRSGGQYHLAARKFADRQMWASAVLNWQRAAANQPNNFAYLRHLCQAYAQLGFYERSLDVLQSARHLADSGTKQAELDRLLAIVTKAKKENEQTDP